MPPLGAGVGSRLVNHQISSKTTYHYEKAISGPFDWLCIVKLGGMLAAIGSQALVLSTRLLAGTGGPPLSSRRGLFWPNPAPHWMSDTDFVDAARLRRRRFFPGVLFSVQLSFSHVMTW